MGCAERSIMVRVALAGLVALSVVSTAAAASPFTIAAGLGMTQDEVNSHQDPNSVLSVLGRAGLSRRFALELELSRVDTGANHASRTATALGVFDLGSNPRWVPHLFAGLGVDDSDVGYGNDVGHHLEAGVGLEYRASSGLVIGARFHIGDRTIDSQPKVDVLACCTDLYSPPSLNDGQYRSLDAYAGVRF
jgi:hypothetical protein